MTSSSGQHGLQIGLDLGGSKIEGILLGPGAKEWARYCVATPRHENAATIAAIVDLTARLMQDITADATIGIAVPGSISPLTGLLQNAEFDLAQRPPLRPRPSSCTFHAGAACQRCQLLRLVRSHRRCRRECADRIRGYPGNRMRRWASSSMGGCSTDHVALAENGATTRFPGPHPTNTPDPNVGAAAKGAWRRGFRVPAWLPIMLG